jgi:hypothetical protein
MILLVRLRRGLVGETQRIVHIVSIADQGATPVLLTAYCGFQFGRGQGEVVAEQGMPCLACLARAPVPDIDAPSPPPPGRLAINEGLPHGLEYRDE